MPFNDPIISALLLLGTAAWGWWIARSVQGNAGEDHGQSIIQYGPGVRAFALLGWMGAVGLTILAIFEPAFPIWARVFISVSGLFIALVLHLELTQAHVRYDSMGVHVISPWRADRVVRWDNFRRARYSNWNDSYVLETENFGKILLHKYLSGTESLLAELSSRGVPVERNV